jgi:hypothetical protein
MDVQEMAKNMKIQMEEQNKEKTENAFEIEQEKN